MPRTLTLAPRRQAVATSLLTLGVLLLAPGAARAVRWGGCRDFAGVRCSTVTVPLDRTGVDPGRVKLRIARIGGRPRTLMYLSGGPGGAGVSEMLSVVETVPELLRRYRVIGFDQRGTGHSGLLRCKAIEKNVRLRSPTAAAACAAHLGTARRHYTTPDSVEDMEAIRVALHVDKLTLFGISYGTELAIEYARAHPQHVERLIVDSVVDPDDRDPFFLTGFRAMPPTLRALCPSRCRGITPDPAADLARLVGRLRVRPMHGTAYDGRGRPHRKRIGPTALYDLMFDSDYDPALRAAVPAAVRAALVGDAAPLARLVREGDSLAGLGSPREFSSARYATICEETPLPWDPGTPVDRRQGIASARAAALGAAAFFPFDPPTAAEDEISLCLRWPDVPRPVPPAETGPYPAVPTLVLQGGEDLRTPPEGSARVAGRIRGAVRVVVPGVGHAVTGDDPSGCGLHALLRFISGRAVSTGCRRVRTGVPGVLAAPDSFDALRGVRGLPRRVGRTLRALAATLDDLRLVLSPAVLTNSGGGLRGGSWAVRGGRRLVLRRYKAVPGVTVTGGGSGRVLRMRVGGRRAAHGTVRLRSGGRLTGRLGGRRIRVRLGSSAASVDLPALPMPRIAAKPARPLAREP